MAIVMLFLGPEFPAPMHRINLGAFEASDNLQHSSLAHTYVYDSEQEDYDGLVETLTLHRIR